MMKNTHDELTNSERLAFRYMLCVGDADRFERTFGCPPHRFKGINAPYAYLGCQESEDLLKKFGFCHMCLGSGTSWAECCDGHRCSCNGDAVPFTCRCCDGKGVYKNEDGNPNFEYLTSIAKNNNGRLLPNRW